MFYASHYFLDIRHLNWEFAHILEHLIIERAKNAIATKIGTRDSFSSIKGETYGKYMFLDGFFDNKDAYDTFESYMSEKLSFTKQEFNVAVGEIEAEYCKIFPYSVDELYERFQKFLADCPPWNTRTNNSAPAIDCDLFKMKCRPGYYVDISVVFTSRSSFSPEANKLLLRSDFFLVDIVSHYLAERLQMYHRATIRTHDHKNIYKLGAIYSVPKHAVNNKLLAADIKTYLQNYPLKERYDHFKKHFELFAKDPFYTDAATVYYKHTGIVTTTKEIANALSLVSLMEIFNGLDVRIRYTTKDDWSYTI